jgi:hypothetical protein
MTRVFSGPLHVSYSQAYVYGRDRFISNMEDCFRGQENGLCGAGVPGALFLITGLHTGSVGFTIDVLDAPPLLDDTEELEVSVEQMSLFGGSPERINLGSPARVKWEEIVEAPLYIDDAITNLALVEWGGGAVYPIPLQPGSYRVRYCARGMDIGRDHGTTLDDDDIVDFYSLAFWPAEATTDRVIKQTSKAAAYWHEYARNLVLRPPAPIISPPILEGLPGKKW